MDVDDVEDEDETVEEGGVGSAGVTVTEGDDGAGALASGCPPRLPALISMPASWDRTATPTSAAAAVAKTAARRQPVK
ncbi:MAG TPA: hypothetical protein VF180_00680 [Acidimicrobiia bacterium]